jgi:glucosamine 6-phosphate synthetase-like amidotransferase/phosphosugar isomerase protein
VVKTGVSDTKPNPKGTSPRGDQQAKNWNKEIGEKGKFKSKVVKEIPSQQKARAKILQWEKENAKKLRSNGELDPSKHQRP